MSLVPFRELMSDAERGRYAVGCFHAWNLPSMLGIADAAESLNSPVMFSVGGSCQHPSDSCNRNRLAAFVAICQDVCSRLTVPTCLMFNEPHDLRAVHAALDLGFNLVTYRDRELADGLALQIMRGLAGWAHHRGAAVEAELPSSTRCFHEPREGFLPSKMKLSRAQEAAHYVLQTGIDALVINVHCVRRASSRSPRIELSQLSELKSFRVPLVLHEPTATDRKILHTAVKTGIRKVNIESVLKHVYRQELREPSSDFGIAEMLNEGADSAGHDGSIDAARLAIRQTVEDYMHLLDSAGKATTAATIVATSATS